MFYILWILRVLVLFLTLFLGLFHFVLLSGLSYCGPELIQPITKPAFGLSLSPSAYTLHGFFDLILFFNEFEVFRRITPVSFLCIMPCQHLQFSLKLAYLTFPASTAFGS